MLFSQNSNISKTIDFPNFNSISRLIFNINPNHTHTLFLLLLLLAQVRLLVGVHVVSVPGGVAGGDGGLLVPTLTATGTGPVVVTREVVTGNIIIYLFF